MRVRIFCLCILGLVTACSDPVPEEAPEPSKPGVLFMVVNFTGHPFPPDQNSCGEPVDVTFHLSSNPDRTQIFMQANYVDMVKHSIEIGELLTVSIVDDAGRTVAERSVVFGDISSPALSQDDYHTISFCQDRIDFNF